MGRLTAMKPVNKNASANRGVVVRKRSTVGEVQGDFKADPQIEIGRFAPRHKVTPAGGRANVPYTYRPPEQAWTDA